MRELFAVVPLVAGFARIQLFMHVFQFENSGWPGDAYTKPELLDQWWAPKPWMSRTKAMDFKVGGRRFYAMVSPEGVERWSVQIHVHHAENQLQTL